MPTRRTHAYTKRIKALKKTRSHKSLTPQEVEELARLIQQYGDVDEP